MSWQPIETAPRDGTRILFFGEKYGVVCIGFCKHEHIWVENFDTWHDGTPLDWQDIATHWMRLPRSPVDKDNERLLRSVEVEALAKEMYATAKAQKCLEAMAQMHFCLNAISRNDSTNAVKWAGQAEFTLSERGHSGDTA